MSRAKRRFLIPPAPAPVLNGAVEQMANETLHNKSNGWRSYSNTENLSHSLTVEPWLSSVLTEGDGQIQYSLEEAVTNALFIWRLQGFSRSTLSSWVLHFPKTQEL